MVTAPSEFRYEGMLKYILLIFHGKKKEWEKRQFLAFNWESGYPGNVVLYETYVQLHIDVYVGIYYSVS